MYQIREERFQAVAIRRIYTRAMRWITNREFLSLSMHFAHRCDGGADRRDGQFALKEIGTHDGLFIASLSCKSGDIRPIPKHIDLTCDHSCSCLLKEIRKPGAEFLIDLLIILLQKKKHPFCRGFPESTKSWKFLSG